MDPNGDEDKNSTNQMKNPESKSFVFPQVLDPASVENLKKWFLKNHTLIWCPEDPELMFQTIDQASQGSRGAPFVSWNSISRCYISGCSVSIEGNPSLGISTDSIDSKRMEDILPVEESSTIAIDKLTITETAGKLVTETSEVLDVTNDPVPMDSIGIQEGYFYSDSLPVRSINVAEIMWSLQNPKPVRRSRLVQESYKYVSMIEASCDLTDPLYFDHQYETSLAMIRLSECLDHEFPPGQEVAAIVRCLCMRLSLASELYATDPIRYRFIRNCTPKGITTAKIRQLEGIQFEGMTIAVTTLDVFGEHCSTLFSRWSAVPIRWQSAFQGSWILAYIASFMGSKLWNGTVMMKSDAIFTNSDGTSVNLKYTMTPVCNSVQIHGPSQILLVLVDRIARGNGIHKISLGNQSIPVWRGQEDYVPTNFGPIWNAYWKTENIGMLRHHLFFAYRELATHFSVDNTLDIAASITAELYGIWYPGLALDSTNDLEPDYSQPAWGAWTIDGSTLDDIGQIKSEKFPLQDTDKELAGRMCAGYNFAGHSSLHLFCPGRTSTQCTALPDGTVDVVWKNCHAEFGSDMYTVPSMTSIARVATYVGLLEVNLTQGHFAPESWFHQLSCILGFSTSVMMVNNDFTTREWAGLSSGDRLDEFTCREMFQKLKGELLCQIIKDRNLKSSAPPFFDSILDYFGEVPFDNPQWMTFSAIPYHCTVQWSKEMELLFGHPNHELILFQREEDSRIRSNCRLLKPDVWSFRITPKFGHHKSHAVGTIDVYRYFPQIFMCPSSSSRFQLQHWFDQVSYYTGSGRHDKSLYESFTFTGRIKSFREHDRDNSYEVVKSNYVLRDLRLATTYVSKIHAKFNK